MKPLNYLPTPVAITTEGDVSYIFEATNYNLPLYFALKGRHEYELQNRDVLISHLQNVVDNFVQQFDVVVIPQSRSDLLKRVISRFPNVIGLSKRDKMEIFSRVSTTPSWRKLDIQSANKARDEMGESFTINTIKSNKRKDYVPHIFHSASIPKDRKVLLLDDFVRSGNTIQAMASALEITEYHTLGIFYQKNIC